VIEPSNAELLAAVERSPQAAAVHDRAAWVGLFADEGRIEDPVGSRPHIGHARIGRFYDTFIGPRRITFHPDVDIVAGTSVIRDLTLEVEMASSVTMMIPAILRYDLRATDRGWRITRLRAYWELPKMMRQFLGNRARSLPASVQLSSALLGNQGLSGTIGFLAGFVGRGRRGKRLVDDMLSASTAAEGIAGGGKLLGAGRWVAASVSTPTGRGVLIAEIDRTGRRIIDTQLFSRN
jgi:hypothetical protein